MIDSTSLKRPEADGARLGSFRVSERAVVVGKTDGSRQGVAVIRRAPTRRRRRPRRSRRRDNGR